MKPVKTKEAALKAARADLGNEAVETVDFQVRNTGAGYIWESIPPANEEAAKAQEKRVETARANGTDPAPAPRPKGKKPGKVAKKAKAGVTAPPKPKAAPKPAPGGAGAKPPRKPPAPASSEPKAQTKTELLISMMKRPGGATSEEMQAAAGGWAPHSVRGLLGTLRSKGTPIESRKVKGEPTCYVISATEAPAAAQPVGDVV